MHTADVYTITRIQHTLVCVSYCTLGTQKFLFFERVNAYVYVCVTYVRGLFLIRTHTQNALFANAVVVFPRVKPSSPVVTSRLFRGPIATGITGVRKFDGGGDSGDSALRIGNSGVRAFSKRATLDPE